MSWRTVVITQRCKLDYKMGYLVVRSDQVQRVFLDEIAVLIIENPAVSLTGILLEALVDHKTRVIFCNEKRSPMAELAPYYGSHDSARKVQQQIEWSESIKSEVWTQIVTEKIKQQAIFLSELGYSEQAAHLEEYTRQIEPCDQTNREGHAAKVYFNAVFGMDFTRSASTPINAALNYGYGIILSAFNREITINGYLTQVGLKHSNIFNHYNLSSDLMEPYRVLVDRAVFKMNPSQFGKEEKHSLITLLSDIVLLSSHHQTVLNAIRLYTHSVFQALNEQDITYLQMYRTI